MPLREENYEAKQERIHFNGSHENIELLLRTVISTNQLSVYGAIADLCNDVPENLGAPGNLQHLIIWKRHLYCRTIPPMHSNGETPSARIRAKILMRV